MKNNFLKLFEIKKYFRNTNLMNQIWRSVGTQDPPMGVPQKGVLYK